jgi:transcriptional regulator with XRE-family HTH domain
MDQEKIGKFIAELRREMGLTQRELAEKLSVSDKTVSKWECGKGLPEVSLMLPLCEVLGITVNELLSGEKLENDAYMARAEENMTALLRERTENKRKLLLEFIVVLITMLSSVTIILLSGLLTLGTPLRILLIVIALVVMFGGIAVAAVLEMTSGYFECPRCGTYFAPTKTAYIMGMHTTMRRHLRCPHCGKKSWCRRRLSRKED